MDDQHFRQILTHFGRSWDGYRKVRRGVKKRLQQHMQALACRSVSEYLQRLDSCPELGRQSELLLTVSISRFFRDHHLWHILEEHLVPELLARKTASLRVWSAGCAGGEEAYSFKILWHELNERCTALPDLVLVATDINPEYLERARTGIYPASSLREVSRERRLRYFEPVTDGRYYAVREFVKEAIDWKEHDLFSHPPGLEFDIIFLRNNVLTYYEPDLQAEALKQILGNLAPGGYLIIGSHEQLPFQPADLLPLPELTYVFKKTAA